MRTGTCGRTARGLAVAVGAGILLASAAPAVNDGFDIFTHFSRLAPGTGIAAGGDGSVVLYTSFFSITNAEDLPAAEDLAEKPFIAQNADLFSWDRRQDFVRQFTATSNIENLDGTGLAIVTANDQAVVESRSVMAALPLVRETELKTVWAAAYRSNADQTIPGPTTTLDEVDARVAAGGDGLIYVKDSDDQTARSVFEFHLFGSETSLGAPSIAMDARPVVEKIKGHNDDVVTGIEIHDVFVAFAGNANVTSDNADLSQEIFLWTRSEATRIVDDTGGASVGNGGVVQVTHTREGTNWAPAVNRRGEVLFLSTADLTGENPDGLPQLFWWREGRRFRQVTHSTSGTFGTPAWSGDGRTAVFSSTADLLRQNPDESSEIYVLRGGRRVRQVTRATVGHSTAPTMDPLGREFAFLTTSPLRGVALGGDGPEVVVARRSGKAVRQLTLTGSGFTNEPPSLVRSFGSLSAIFVSDEDFNGRNIDHSRRIFVAPVDSD